MVQIKENMVNIEIGKSDDKISKKLGVFYNPIMKFNRDCSVLLLNALDSLRKKKDINVTEYDCGLTIGLPLSGSGIRGLRFLKELNKNIIKEIHFNDYKDDFNVLMKNNIKINKVHYEPEKLSDNNKNNHNIINIHNKEANLFLHQSSGFDYIDIDPFGTPNPFLDNAVKRISRAGILAITATDTSALAGTYPKACKRKYFAVPLRIYLMHELGIRILIRKVQLIGAQYDKALIPIFTYAKDHYYRIFFRCEKGKTKVDEVLKQHKYFLYCNKCMNFFVDMFNKHDCGICNRNKTKKEHDKIENSNKQMIYAGPLWVGKLFDKNVVRKMKRQDYIKVIKQEDNETQSRENIRFFEMLCEEALAGIDNNCNGDCIVGFYEIPEVMKMFKIGDSIKLNELMDGLKKRKYKVVRTHFGKQAVKSDCGVDDIIEVMRER
ncbi:MAG: hypothetical protein ABIG89_00615 [Candidatus Woesearchaeota archaeon]